MQHRSKKRSAVELRREQLAAQLEHLRSQLASKSRKDFTTDFRHEAWIRQSHDLIDELSAELSALNEPGEYDELPTAVVADELGLRLNQVRQLIRLGEVEAAGRRAHERVNRRELERLVSMGVDEILKRADESVDVVFHGEVAGKGVTSVCVGRRALGGIALRTIYVTFERPTLAAVKMVNAPAFFGTWAASIHHEDVSACESRMTYRFHFRAEPRLLGFMLEPLMKAVFVWETRKRLRALRSYLERTYQAGAR